MMILAILPAVILLAYICHKDKVEKEPPQLLVRLFIWGALTVISAIVLGSIGQEFLLDLAEPESMMYLLVDNFLLTALVEEGGKYVVLKKITWDAPHFNYTFDAVVYAVTVSLGFATLENIAYLVDATLDVAILRGVMSVPGHAIDAVFMGCYYGEARQYDLMGDWKQSRRSLKKALLVPVLLHGFYDFCLESGYDLFVMAFFLFEIIITITAIRKVRQLSAQDMPL